MHPIYLGPFWWYSFISLPEFTHRQEQVRVQAAGRARSPRSGARNAQSTQAAARSRQCGTGGD